MEFSLRSGRHAVAAGIDRPYEVADDLELGDGHADADGALADVAEDRFDLERTAGQEVLEHRRARERRSGRWVERRGALGEVARVLLVGAVEVALDREG